MSGRPVPVDVSRNRLDRVHWLVFLGGPVIWFAHFMLVYLVAEAGCQGGGPGLRAFNPPVPTGVTLGATVVAALACLGLAAWAWTRWKRQNVGTFALSSLLLALFSLIAVLFVGAPALVLEC